MDFFFFDYETFCIQPSLQAPPIVCMSWTTDGKPNLVHARDRTFDSFLESVLRDQHVTMVAHRAAFEAVCTMAHKPEWTDLLFDKLDQGKFLCTIVREKLKRIGLGDHREGFGLDDLAAEYRLNISPDKSCPWRLRFGTLIGTPISEWPADAVKYALEDLCVRDIYFEQERLDPKYRVTQAHETRTSVALTLMQTWGFPVNGVKAQVLYDETEAELEEHQKTVEAHGLIRQKKEKGQLVWVRDMKAAAVRITEAYAAQGREPPRGDVTPSMLAKAYKASGLPIPPSVEKLVEQNRVRKAHLGKNDIRNALVAGVSEEFLRGNIKLDEDACLLSGDPVMKAYTQYSQADTLLGKARRYLLAAKAGQPIQCSYNELVNTGRTSCRQGDDPAPGEAWMAYGAQVQNLPRE